MGKSDKKTYFVTGGGTGGHIYPAVSIAKALREDEQTQKVYYVGCKNNPEEKIAKEEGFEFLPVEISYMPRKLGFDFLKWGFKLDKAVWKSLYYIYKYKPDAVFGTGGYASAPAIIGAWLSGTPYVIHDSDAHPGIVSRYVSKGAQLVSVAFESAKKFIKNDNIEVFGNPIKSEFYTLTKEAARKELNLGKEPVLLIMGGSQGAMNINHTAINCMRFFVEKLKISVILQTGTKNYDAAIDMLNKTYPEYTKTKRVIVRPYFSNMALPLMASDLVVARAGSLSLSEIAACERPSVLIPFPHAAADHQRKNARCYEEAGASIYIDDFELNKEILEKTIEDLFKNPEKIAKMKTSVKSFCKPNATEQIVLAIKKAAQNK